MKRLVWLVVNVLQWLFIAFCTAVLTSIAVPLSALTRRPRIGLAMARRLWAPAVMRAALVRVETVGAEVLAPDSAWFLACNHQSFADIPILFAGLPLDLRFVAKRELRRVPFMGWYMEAMGMVFVDRRRRKSGAAGIDAVTTLLREGGCVLSFPAGTRRAPGEAQEWKAAAFAPALAAGVPVVPVAVHGTRAMLPPGFGLRPGTAQVMIGEPIPTAGLPLSARDEVAQRAEAAVEAMLAQLAATAAEVTALASSPAPALPTSVG